MINSANEYEPGLLNTLCATRVKKNSKFYKECMSSLALLPPRDFAVFERQFKLKKFHQVLNSTSSLAAWTQFISYMFPSARKAVCK